MDEQQYATKQYKVKLSDFYKCGKLAVHKKSLMSNKLKVVYWPSLASFSKIRVQSISDELVDFILNIANNKANFDMSLFYNLSLQEESMMDSFLLKSGYGQEIDFDLLASTKNQLQILQGEIATGNDNQALKKQAQELLIRLVQASQMSQADCIQILQSFN